MSLPAFSVRNSVLVNMLMFVVLVGGGLFSFTLTREMFPESRPDRLSITAVHPGRQAAEIEKAVTIKIEEALRDLDAIEKIDSSISEGFSNSVVTLYSDAGDVDIILQEIKTRIDAVQDLPDDVEQLSFRKLEPRLPVIAVSLFGEGSEEELKTAAEEMRDQLLRLEGISDVQMGGTRDDEISVEVLPEKLQKFDVTFDQVANAISRSNLDISSGQIKGRRKSIPVRVIGEETTGDELTDIVVSSDGEGRQILLGDVARVRDDFIESDLQVWFNAKPSVSCTVYKTGSQDAIQIASLIRAYVLGKQGKPFDPYGVGAAYDAALWAKPFALVSAYTNKALSTVAGRTDPEAVYEAALRTPFTHNFEIRMHTDLSRYISGRLDLMTRNGKSGLVLVLICLYLFLNRRVAFWTAFGLPVSFLGTFIVMWCFGVTLNLLSIFGLIIVLGIIVDDAIVIGENIYRRVEEGEDPEAAAINGAEEVMWPVTVAVMTTIAAFAPLLFVSGQIGDFMEQLPLVVIAALTVSLLEALIILPAHLAHLPSQAELEAQSRKRAESFFGRMGDRMTTFQQWLMKDLLGRRYEALLRVALRWRYVTMAIAVATLMVVFGMFEGGVVERVFVQKMDSETLVCSLKMPVGTTAENTRRELLKLSRHATGMEEVDHVEMIVGRQYDVTGAGAVGTTTATHLGQIILELHESDERNQRGLRSSDAVLASMRDYGRIHLSGVNSVSWEELNGGPGGKAISIKISGESFPEVVAVVDRLKLELSKYDGVYDLDDTYEEGQKELLLNLKKSAEPTGVTTTILGSHVRSALYGREAKRLTRDREDVRIMVRYPRSFRESEYALESMRIPIQSQNGIGWVPLSDLATIEEAEAESTIYRSQRERSITLTGEVDDAAGNSSEILQSVSQAFTDQIQQDYPTTRIDLQGREEEQVKAFGSLRLAFPIALMMVYMLLAGLFKSYVQPIVVMSAIPFGLQGAVVGHWMTGNPMTILSWIGMVALTGILVNDSLVLVDFINTRVRDGLDEFEASIQGATLRLRAILLTTMTTVAGLTPLMFETSFQAKFLIPMAVTLTFGLVFATALTLIIVPCLNMIFFDARRIGQTIVSGTPDASREPHSGTDESPVVPQSSV